MLLLKFHYVRFWKRIEDNSGLHVFSLFQIFQLCGLVHCCYQVFNYVLKNGASCMYSKSTSYKGNFEDNKLKTSNYNVVLDSEWLRNFISVLACPVLVMWNYTHHWRGKQEVGVSVVPWCDLQRMLFHEWYLLHFSQHKISVCYEISRMWTEWKMFLFDKPSSSTLCKSIQWKCKNTS
jgi:hypothetical protein